MGFFNSLTTIAFTLFMMLSFVRANKYDIHVLPKLAVGNFVPKYEIKRLVPSGPSHEQNPRVGATIPSEVSASKIRSRWRVKRLVPSGPNPVESPESPLAV